LWWQHLDDRYQLEVHQQAPGFIRAGQLIVADECYSGLFAMFDHAEDDRLVYSKPVALWYGAPFGPDIENVSEWEQLGIEVVDEILPKRQG
jgi:hypothetical protein